MLLSKEQLLERRLKTERIQLDEGAEIIVRAVPLHVVERANEIDDPRYGADAFVFVNAVVDEQGKRIYTDEDAPLVAGLDTAMLQLVVSKAYALARLTPEQMEQIKKNWKNLADVASGE